MATIRGIQSNATCLGVYSSVILNLQISKEKVIEILHYWKYNMLVSS